MGDERFDMVDTFLDAAHVKVTARRLFTQCWRVPVVLSFLTSISIRLDLPRLNLLRLPSQTQMCASKTSREPRSPRRTE